MHTNLYICQTNFACECGVYDPDGKIFLLQVKGQVEIGGCSVIRFLMQYKVFVLM
jgi:hypothetical protein